MLLGFTMRFNDIVILLMGTYVAMYMYNYYGSNVICHVVMMDQT